MGVSRRCKGTATLAALLFVPVSLAGPQQHKTAKSGGEADITAIGNRKTGRGPNFYSIDRELALGNRLAREVERSTKLIEDPLVKQYVNGIGQNLVRHSDAKFAFTFKVIDSEEVDAFALPGGFLYVNSGLIVQADEESELAGVMAHEIAHVCARHGTRIATKLEIARVASMSLIFLGPGGWAGSAIYAGLKVAVPLTFLQFSRSAEREADYLGLQYMYSAGYDPDSFITFFEKIGQDENPGKFSRIVSGHPILRDRIRAAQNEITAILPTRDAYIVTTSEFEVIKERLRSMAADQTKECSACDRRPKLRNRTEQVNGPPSIR